MKKFIFLILLISSIITAQENFVKLIVPEADTVISYSSTYRLSASTLPNSRVNINGKDFFVYSSGAFAGVLDVKSGVNNYKIVSENQFGIAEKEFVIIKEEFELETSTTDSLVIENILMLPNQNMWLTKDDILEVRIKGTPGCKASFLNGIEMRELNTEESPRGIQGVYVGRYKVKETDELEEQPITFTLEKDGQAISKISNAMIAFMNKDFPLIAKTIDERSELNYGLGTNRLGGAKLSFIHEDIKLMIDGKVDDMFRVRLNENNIAWIPIDQVEILPYGSRVPNALTENFTVWGDDRYDYVNVSIGEKLPFSSFQEPSERKIHIDIYGAVSNTNWITQYPTTKEIKNIYYNQIEENLLRITIELKHKQLWGYSVNYEGRGLQIKIKQQPKDLDLDNLKIVIDAGHGGPTNNGALGSTGLTEKEVNLSTALHLKKLLEDEGAKVVMTRSEDISVWNSERLKSAIEEEPDLLVSIHANSIGLTSDPTKTSGTSTYYKHIAFRPLSQKIYKRMLELGLAPYGNVGNFNFTLNSQTEMPNVLVELAFMSNPEDEILLMNDEFRKEMAEKIFEGIEDFLDWCED